MTQKAVGEAIKFMGRAVEPGWDNLKEPGDFYISDLGHPGQMFLRMQCPCGCGDTRHIPIQEGPHLGQGHPWGWNGDKLKPVITPSIKYMDLCHFHGHLGLNVPGEWTGVREG